MANTQQKVFILHIMVVYLISLPYCSNLGQATHPHHEIIIFGHFTNR